MDRRKFIKTAAGVFVPAMPAIVRAKTVPVVHNKAGSSAPFSPTNISGLKLWFKGDAGITLGTGTNITRWADQSGNGNDLTQGDGTSCPTKVSAAQNGLAVVNFAGGTGGTGGSNQSWNLTNTILPDPRTEIIVWRKVAGDFLFCACDTGGKAFEWYNDESTYTFTSSDLWNVAATLSASAYHYCTCSTNGTGTPTIYYDGVSQTLTHIGSNSHTNMTQLGQSGSTWATGRIAEYLVYDTVLSTGNRQSVESYLKTRWGL